MTEIKYVPPSYKISDKVVCLVVNTELMLKDISNADISAASTSKLVDAATFDNLYFLSQIVGKPLTRGEIKKIAVGRFPTTPLHKLLSNYRSVMEYTRSLISSSLGDFSYNTLLHANKLLCVGLVDEWDTGRIRTPTDRIDDRFEIFPPKKIDSLIVAKLLPQFISWLSSGYDIHPFFKSVVLLSDLIQMYPFPVLNTATTIAAFDIFMNLSGLGGDGIVPVVRILGEELEEFKDIYKGVVTSGEEIEPLIEFVALEWNKIVNEVRGEVVKLSYHEEVKGKTKFLNLNHRQLAVLRYLQNHPKITRREFMKLFKVSTMTAYRDLSDLLEKKLLVAQGLGRGTYYVLFTKG
jgi:Fic family protein